ncbi:MAG: 1-acyl-sn-glycerol-3-phosphate acyltransferase [Ectothiorhodospiraceae bacterium]|nr:1-acyl-sn-glycerol-3-phosphate acyltransferase [Ectothiorhodospiraceae bacterium]
MSPRAVDGDEAAGKGGHRPGRRPVTAGLILRSALFGVGQVVLTVVFATVAVLAIPLPYRLRFHAITRWNAINLWWLGVTCGLRHEVSGLENAPDRPCIVLCKHQSAWETLALAGYFVPQAWVVKRELLRIPFFGWGLAALRPIAIDRAAGKDALAQVLEQGRQRLDDGLWVVIFPEGTRTAPGVRRRYRIGGARLAAETGVPVLPIAHNSGDYWPRHSFLKRPGTIRMIVGKPIDPAGRSATEINCEVEEWIEATVARLRAEAGFAPYDAPPPPAPEDAT